MDGKTNASAASEKYNTTVRTSNRGVQSYTFSAVPGTVYCVMNIGGAGPRNISATGAEILRSNIGADSDGRYNAATIIKAKSTSVTVTSSVGSQWLYWIIA